MYERSPWEISQDKQGFIEMVIDRLGRDPKTLQHLFLTDANKSC